MKQFILCLFFSFQLGQVFSQDYEWYENDSTKVKFVQIDTFNTVLDSVLMQEIKMTAFQYYLLGKSKYYADNNYNGLKIYNDPNIHWYNGIYDESFPLISVGGKLLLSFTMKDFIEYFPENKKGAKMVLSKSKNENFMHYNFSFLVKSKDELDLIFDKIEGVVCE